MNNEIGDTAGVLWELLSKKGSLTITQLTKQSRKDEFMVAAAAGWLARENKIDLAKSGRAIRASLVEPVR